MWRKISSLLISLCLAFQQMGFASIATELNLAGHLSKMSSGFVADRFRPVHIRFCSFDALNDNIKVMLDRGDLKDLKGNQLNASTKELLNYFLVGVNLPNDKFWVNLRPDSENNIIDDYLARTDVGKIMLETDLQLKKDTALFTSPETPEGREYWDRLYKKAEELYGYQEVTIPTLTRPWIVPNEIIVRETKDSAYIYKATLKVMLEQDYLKDSATYSFKDARAKALNEYSSQLIRELIIPKLTKEVNLSKRYAPLRQVYYSIILSRWFKSHFTGQAGKYASRIDRKDLSGLTSVAAWSKTAYFEAYKNSFAKGEYNIKETVRTPTGQVIRSYFSGGQIFNTEAVAKATQGMNILTKTSSAITEAAALRAGLVASEEMAISTQANKNTVTSSPLTSRSNFELLHQNPEAVKALANRDLTGINVLIRVNTNVVSNAAGEIEDPVRLEEIREIVNFVLSRGGTPVLYGHNGRLDTKKNKDGRQSLVDSAKYLQDNVFPATKIKMHENSISNDGGLKIRWDNIEQGKPNLIENVRFADDYEVGAKRMIFAQSLINLAGDKDGNHKILIFDAFGDIGSDGASVQTVPFLADEVYVGPAMVREFNTLENLMVEGFDALIFGGGAAKPEKANLLDSLVDALRPGGFSLIASGLSPWLNENKDILEGLRKGDPERVITALDYQDQTTYDIGPEAINKFLAKLDTLKSGQKVVINGTMGFVEEKSGKYQVGTKAINEKLIELAARGVIIIVVGGDATSSAKKYGLEGRKNVVTFTGGGVSLSILANETLVGLKAITRRQEQLKLKESASIETEETKEIIHNVGITGGRGRMGKHYLRGFWYNPKFQNEEVRVINSVPLKDLDIFLKTLTTPDSTYGEMFPGLKIVSKPVINEKEKYAIIEITGFENQKYDDQGKPITQKILLLDDREGAVRWNLVGELFGEKYLTGLGIVESSGKDQEARKAMKKHIASVEDGIVEFGAPPKDEETPIIVFGVNEDKLDTLNSQVYSNASCTTNAIAPFAKILHKARGIIVGLITTLHSVTGDQNISDIFRGDEAARGRAGHKTQSISKTGAATLLQRLIEGIGPHDGKAIRVGGPLSGSVVMEIAELEKPATVEEVREIVIQAAKENPRVIGYGYNLSSKDILRDSRSAIVDLALIKVSADGKSVIAPIWYDNEWGYAERVLDSLQRTLNSRDKGTRTEDFKTPPKPTKEVKKPKTTPASEIEGITSKGPLPMIQVPQKPVTGKETEIYLTGIKEKKLSRNGQIFLRKLLGDARFDLQGIVIDGLTNKDGTPKEDFKDQMDAFAASIRFSSDLGNIEGLEIIPVLTDKGDMGLIFAAGVNKRLVKVLPSLPKDLGPEVKVIDVTKSKYSFLEMINTVSNAVKPLGAGLHSAVLSMSVRPETEMLDSGKGVSVINMAPVKVDELDKAGILYVAYQSGITSGTYVSLNFKIDGILDKAAIDKAMGAIPGIVVENKTSNFFAAERPNVIYDKAQTVIVQNRNEGKTLASVFLLVNEELNAVNKTLEAIAPSAGASSAIVNKVNNWLSELKVEAASQASDKAFSKEDIEVAIKVAARYLRDISLERRDRYLENPSIYLSTFQRLLGEIAPGKYESESAYGEMYSELLMPLTRDIGRSLSYNRDLSKTELNGLWKVADILEKGAASIKQSASSAINIQQAIKPYITKLEKERFEERFRRWYGVSLDVVQKEDRYLAEIAFDMGDKGEKSRLGWTVANLEWIFKHWDTVKNILKDAEDIRRNYKYVIFCGMGGSGLSVQVVKDTFGEKGTKIYSLRTTDPQAIKDILDEIAGLEGSLDAGLAKTLVIPVSKSGRTQETLSHKQYFEELFTGLRMDIKKHMWVVTDKDSPMDTGVYTQKEIQLNGKGDIGGRFTAPTTNVFLLPLAIVAPERVANILSLAKTMNDTYKTDDFTRLAAYLYYMAERLGKDKVTMIMPDELKSLPMWAEQLFEESLGKEGKGVSLFYGEKMSPEVLKPVEQNDRVFFRINIDGKQTQEKLWDYLVKNNYPVFELNVKDTNSIGGIMLGLQRTVAAIAYLWGICFVDQPAVEGYKKETKEVYTEGKKVEVPSEWGYVSFNTFKLYYSPLIEEGIISRARLIDEVKKLGGNMDDAASVYAAIISILKAGPNFQAAEITSYGRITPGLREALDGARYEIFTKGLKMPSKLGEGPDKNHSYHQNIDDGRKMWFSTYFMANEIGQPAAKRFDENLLKAQAIGTDKSLIKRNRPVVLIAFNGTTEASEKDVKDFFNRVSDILISSAAKSNSAVQQLVFKDIPRDPALLPAVWPAVWSYESSEIKINRNLAQISDGKTVKLVLVAHPKEDTGELWLKEPGTPSFKQIKLTSIQQGLVDVFGIQLDGNKSEIRVNLESLQKVAKELKKEIDGNRLLIATLDSGLSVELVTEFSSAAASSAIEQSDIKELKARVDSLRGDIKRRNQQIDNIKKTVFSLDSDMTGPQVWKLEKWNERDATEISKINQQILELEKLGVKKPAAVASSAVKQDQLRNELAAVFSQGSSPVEQKFGRKYIQSIIKDKKPVVDQNYPDRDIYKFEKVNLYINPGGWGTCSNIGIDVLNKGDIWVKFSFKSLKSFSILISKEGNISYEYIPLELITNLGPVKLRDKIMQALEDIKNSDDPYKQLAKAFMSKDQSTSSAVQSLSNRERFINQFVAITTELSGLKEQGASVKFKTLDDGGQITLVGPRDGSWDRKLSDLMLSAQGLGIPVAGVSVTRSFNFLPDTYTFNVLKSKIDAVGSSPVNPGGIDFRSNAMMINYQPMGNFANLNLKLPVLSKAELADFNINEELSGIERMVDSQMVPSGQRLKELLAACSQKGELEGHREQLMALMVRIGILEETQCCLQEASNEYKEALVLTDSLT